MSYFNDAAKNYATACRHASNTAMTEAAAAMRLTMTLCVKAQRCNLRVTLLQQGVSVADLEAAVTVEWEKQGWPPVSPPPTSSTGATPPSPSPGT